MLDGDTPNMDKGKLPVYRMGAVASSNNTTSSLTSQQTFTTAGTPYRQTSQSFQRPERRNRFRFGDTIRNGLSLFPKHDVQRILANGGANPSSAHQYTPLQQNNDRAVNPAHSSEHFSVNMGPPVSPQRHSGNPLASPPGFSFSQFGHLGTDAYDHEDIDIESEEEQEEEEGPEDEKDIGLTKNHPMSGMTLKSIQSLASFSNPHQAAARRILNLRARISLNAMPVYDGTSNPSARTFEVRHVRRGESISPPLQRRAHPNGSPEPFNPISQYVMRMNAGSSVERSHLTRRRDFALDVADGYEAAGPSSTILAPGPGAPRPLTAGPPGQRQLPSSNGHSTAGGRNIRRPITHFGNPHMFPDFQQSLLQAGVVRPSPLLYEAGTSGAFADATNQEDTDGSWTTADDDTPQTYPTYLGMQSSRIGVQYEHGTGRMTKKTMQNRARKANFDWQDGADFFTRPADEVADEIYQSARSCGFKIPTFYDASAEKKTTNGIPAVECADPMMNLVLAKLRRFQQGENPEQGPSFWPVD